MSFTLVFLKRTRSFSEHIFFWHFFTLHLQAELYKSDINIISNYGLVAYAMECSVYAWGLTC